MLLQDPGARESVRTIRLTQVSIRRPVPLAMRQGLTREPVPSAFASGSGS